jgi:prophage regulatory protein
MSKVFEVMRLPAVVKATGYSRSQIWQKISEKTFPAPIKLSSDGRAIGWVADEIARYQRERIAERDGKGAA